MKTYFWRGLSISIIITLSLGGFQKANATGLGIASDYNVFTFGDFNEQNTDIEGKLAAGGNINFVGNSIGNKLAANSGNVLVAGKNLTLTNGQVNNGNAIYGGNAYISSEGFTNGKASRGNPIDFSAAAQELKSLSLDLASLSATGNTKVQYGGISLTGTDSQLNVFNLDSSTLSNANNFQINSNAGSTVVVNISGTSVSLKNFGFNILNTDKQHILYNFYQATSITDYNVGIEGSILAPLANFAFNGGNVEGNVIVNSLTGVGESHNYLFQGNLPSKRKVPEPNNLLGLGLIAAILRLSRGQQ
ncbi:MAG: choice-of-anchor A family protein [Stigonema ocellatum SAG 48.90 = DSM 106950]|nr:choice-of-anchor A family protein [Stigonema ocellatum SAG 48.90 = DSM 106950]